MADFHLAPSLERLRAEIDRRYPGRDKTSDGWIGDTSHQARPSDHNPDWSRGGVVRAIDVDVDDRDPSGDLRTELLKAAIADPRTYYVITNGFIYSRTYNFAKRAYTGSNGHFSHVHISIRSGHVFETSTELWLTLPKVSLANVRAQAEAGGSRKLRGVRRVQRALNVELGTDLPVDGEFGPRTRKAYASWERQCGGDGDGIPGKFSLTKLGEGRFKVRT